MTQAIVVESLTKIYPRVKAVDDISFSIDEGEIFGLLGPNGAGKTTTIRILLTLSRPTSGSISIFGINQTSHPEKVRQMAGYVPQEVSVDGELTGYENILLYAKLYAVPRRERGERIREILGYLELEERANDMVNTYSGGMMRRLEMAQTLVNRPRVLFLDEPSIGLDPAAQRTIWELINRLRDDFKATILLTTHDMNEADTLCDRVGIMDRGRLVVTGQPSRLKTTVGGDVLTISSGSTGCSERLAELGYTCLPGPAPGQFELRVNDGEALIPRLLESLKQAGVAVEAVSLKKPTLDDVFLKYTGGRLEGGGTWAETRRVRRSFRKLTK